MVIGTMSLPESLKDNGFEWFKKYYDLTIKGKIEESAEDVYLLLGGKLTVKNKKVASPE